MMFLLATNCLPVEKGERREKWYFVLFFSPPPHVKAWPRVPCQQRPFDLPLPDLSGKIQGPLLALLTQSLIILEICYRKILGKLLRISSENGGKQTKGKKWSKNYKEKKMYNVWEYGFSGILTRSLRIAFQWSVHPWLLRHAATEYCRSKMIVLKAFFSAVNAVWSGWSCTYHEFKDT